jgi:hypothetical protein
MIVLDPHKILMHLVAVGRVWAGESMASQTPLSNGAGQMNRDSSEINQSPCRNPLAHDPGALAGGWAATFGHCAQAFGSLR